MTGAEVVGGEDAVAEAMKSSEQGSIIIEAQVENGNSFPTDEVIQVYVRAEEAQDAKRNCALCGFERVHLEALEKKNVEIRIAAENLLVVNEEGQEVKEGSGLHFWVGTSQPDRVSERLTGRIPVELTVRLV